MIPTWQPDPGQLADAVGSVLPQARASGSFEIAIVDDGSPRFDGEAFLREVGAQDVTLYRHAEHVGIAGNWNRCLQLARGHRVHLLHQDDFVRDGFYRQVGVGLDAHEAAGAAFVQPAYVDAAGRPLPAGVQVADEPGILDEWVEHIFVSLKFACAGVVVRRSLYERLGGFDSRFRYCLDWDMWKRIAVATPIWYEPLRLACSRIHPGSATARLQRSGRNLTEIAMSIEGDRAYLGPVLGGSVGRRARARYTQWALQSARALFRTGRPLGALVQIWAAGRISSHRTVLWLLLGSTGRRWQRWRERQVAGRP
jgi:hypothetical protein